MKILVADDEQIMLDSIASILKNEPDTQLDTVRTGREAIEKTELTHPDLIVMDIKMPGINGLEAIAEIRRIDPQVLIVILSAYDNFIYAQEAIHHRVFDYLVKPINKTRILEMINKARFQLEQNRLARQEDLKVREKYKKLLPLIENEFIDAVMNGADRDSLEEYQELLGVQFSSGFIGAVFLLPELEPFNLEIETHYNLREKMIRLADEIHHLFPCFVGFIRNPLIFFAPAALDGEAPIIEYQQLIAQRILDRVSPEIAPGSFRIGLGSVCDSVIEYHRSYREAFEALNSPAESRICYFQQLETGAYPWEKKFDKTLAEVLEAIRFGRAGRAQLLITDFCSGLVCQDETEYDRLLCCLCELLLSAYRVSKNYIPDLKLTPPGYRELIGLFAHTTDIRELSAIISAKVVHFTKVAQERIQTHTKTLILHAKGIIDHRYAEELSLDELARSVAVSPFYLCRLFKEELGCSFTEYLTGVRLERARSLLALNLPVKECSYRVGYQDPNYFSRIFRKFYNMTPSEYREEHIPVKGVMDPDER